MQDYPLTIDHFFNRAERLFAHKEIVTSTATGIHRTTYGDWAARSRRIPAALQQLGVKPGERVGTFAWNTHRHLELWYAVPMSGAVLHTLNIRLFADQLAYVINHAEDKVIFVDRSLMKALWNVKDKLTTVKTFIVMDDGIGDLPPKDPRVIDYEDLLAGSGKPLSFPDKDENSPASMCYTSGTTGNPKGVMYTHRSLVLHTMGVMMSSSIGVSERDSILPVVPMFHANAWGLAHASVAAGSKLIMPGAFLSGKNLANLIESEKVTVAAGVPTIWMALLPELKGRDVSSLRVIPCGGSAVPRALSEAYRVQVGLPLLQAWGMTETSPVGSICHLGSAQDNLSDDKKAAVRTTVGIPVPLVDVRIVDDDGKEGAWDGITRGELQCRGPYIAASYYKIPHDVKSFSSDGWFCSGDVATISKEGYITIVDRTKDLIKSGGEWVSSVEVECEIMAHPKIAEACVIAVHSHKWMERPMACVVLKPNEQLTHEELIEFLTPRMSKWWLPDATEFIKEIPKTSVGKFSKKDLRTRFEKKSVP